MTVPGEQFVIRRMAYAMIKKAFDENGIKFAFPTVQVAGEAEAATAAAAVAQRGLELTQRSRVTDRKDALFAVSCSPGRPVTAYRFQFGERLDKAFESIPRGATLGGRERDLERRIRRRYRHCPLRSRQIDTDRQLIAVLIVNYLVRLRHSDPGRRGSRNRREPPATTTHPEHALPCSCYCAEALPR